GHHVDEVRLPLPFPIRKGAVHREPERGDRDARLGVAQLRIRHEATDQYHAVQHILSPFRRGDTSPGPPGCGCTTWAPLNPEGAGPADAPKTPARSPTFEDGA